jgi:hypothetical protein
MTKAHSSFELGECDRQVAVAKGQQTDPQIGKREATGVLNRLSNLDPFFPECPALSECT